MRYLRFGIYCGFGFSGLHCRHCSHCSHWSPCVETLKSKVNNWLSQPVIRSPIELSWTAKKSVDQMSSAHLVNNKGSPIRTWALMKWKSSTGKSQSSILRPRNQNIALHCISLSIHHHGLPGLESLPRADQCLHRPHLLSPNRPPATIIWPTRNPRTGGFLKRIMIYQPSMSHLWSQILS